MFQSLRDVYDSATRDFRQWYVDLMGRPPISMQDPSAAGSSSSGADGQSHDKPLSGPSSQIAAISSPGRRRPRPALQRHVSTPPARAPPALTAAFTPRLRPSLSADVVLSSPKASNSSVSSSSAGRNITTTVNDGEREVTVSTRTMDNKNNQHHRVSAPSTPRLANNHQLDKSVSPKPATTTTTVSINSIGTAAARKSPAPPNATLNANPTSNTPKLTISSSPAPRHPPPLTHLRALPPRYTRASSSPTITTTTTPPMPALSPNDDANDHPRPLPPVRAPLITPLTTTTRAPPTRSRSSSSTFASPPPRFATPRRSVSALPSSLTSSSSTSTSAPPADPPSSLLPMTSIARKRVRGNDDDNDGLENSDSALFASPSSSFSMRRQPKRSRIYASAALTSASTTTADASASLPIPSRSVSSMQLDLPPKTPSATTAQPASASASAASTSAFKSTTGQTQQQDDKENRMLRTGSSSSSSSMASSSPPTNAAAAKDNTKPWQDRERLERIETQLDGLLDQLHQLTPQSSRVRAVPLFTSSPRRQPPSTTHALSFAASASPALPATSSTTTTSTEASLSNKHTKDTPTRSTANAPFLATPTLSTKSVHFSPWPPSTLGNTTMPASSSSSSSAATLSASERAHAARRRRRSANATTASPSLAHHHSRTYTPSSGASSSAATTNMIMSPSRPAFTAFTTRNHHHLQPKLDYDWRAPPRVPLHAPASPARPPSRLVSKPRQRSISSGSDLVYNEIYQNMEQLMRELPHVDLRSAQMIPGPDGTLIENRFWHEIYGKS
ncbi:hypothetical protein BC940DRAFT_364828 [Gongronella butleri]|nr:hypothetical protein BC940DRAFT_364828 [Gongronella butleri]